MIHNFADPLNQESANANVVDQKYFNVPWSGVRPSNLPNALEPRARSISSTTLSYFPPNNVDILSLKGWGGDDKNQYLPCAFNSYRENLNKLGGYTTFAGDGLLISRPEILRFCRKHNYTDASDCHAAGGGVEATGICMVSSCRCEDDVAPAEGYTEIDLKVPPDTKPTCTVSGNVYTLSNTPYVELKCSFRDTGFGKTGVFLEGNFGFYRGDTGVGLEVLYIRHWSWATSSDDDGMVHFATNYVDDGSGGVNRTAAKNYVQNLFDNTGSSEELKIEFQYSSSPPAIIPDDYDAGSVSAFTFVYGQGQDYASNVPGHSRRRIGTSGRDFTVFTIK